MGDDGTETTHWPMLFVGFRKWAVLVCQSSGVSWTSVTAELSWFPFGKDCFFPPHYVGAA